ncbi:hypothetical protein BDW74DRAFT_23910 [Aspergillus multicolor]|uniref:uncharacterized protein n=1 Tax=Aspergillus multicolor TaxID=41759 RepID=UPI003CCD5A8B
MNRKIKPRPSPDCEIRPMAPVRRVINTQWVTDFLQYILNHDGSSILIVCAARETFLEQLLAAIHLQPTAPASHELVTKTLGLLSTSHKVRTVYCPTLEHLRAYLSTGEESWPPATEGKQESLPLLAILNPLTLHRSTREFSAQGLSRTFASAVEVSFRANMGLVLCECRDALDPNNTELGEACWYADVPLLSSSLRPGTDGNYWTGRAVPIKRVVQRWFQFTDLSK